MGGVVGRKGGAGLLQRKQSEKQQNKFPIRFEVETIRAVDHVLFSSCFFFFSCCFCVAYAMRRGESPAAAPAAAARLSLVYTALQSRVSQLVDYL